MSDKTKLEIPIDKNLEADAERVLGKLGLDLDTAIEIFLKQVVLFKGMPFYNDVKTSGAKISAGQMNHLQEFRCTQEELAESLKLDEKDIQELLNSIPEN